MRSLINKLIVRPANRLHVDASLCRKSVCQKIIRPSDFVPISSRIAETTQKAANPDDSKEVKESLSTPTEMQVICHGLLHTRKSILECYTFFKGTDNPERCKPYASHDDP